MTANTAKSEKSCRIGRIIALARLTHSNRGPFLHAANVSCRSPSALNIQDMAVRRQSPWWNRFARSWAADEENVVAARCHRIPGRRQFPAASKTASVCRAAARRVRALVGLAPYSSGDAAVTLPLSRCPPLPGDYTQHNVRRDPTSRCSPNGRPQGRCGIASTRL